MSLSPSDKIILTKYPPLPSKCAVCHHGSDGQLEFVDFALSFDYEGAVTICTSCMINVAQVLDLIPRSEVESLEAQVRVLTTRCQELVQENDSLNRNIDSILDIRPALSDRSMAADEGTSSGVVLDSGQLLLPIGPRETINDDATDEVDATDRGNAKQSPKR